MQLRGPSTDSPTCCSTCARGGDRDITGASSAGIDARSLSGQFAGSRPRGRRRHLRNGFSMAIADRLFFASSRGPGRGSGELAEAQPGWMPMARSRRRAATKGADPEGAGAPRPGHPGPASSAAKTSAWRTVPGDIAVHEQGDPHVSNVSGGVP